MAVEYIKHGKSDINIGTGTDRIRTLGKPTQIRTVKEIEALDVDN
jgi:hypothetical protein